MSFRRLLPAFALALLVACVRHGQVGPVRDPLRASEIAQSTLRAAGLDEEVVDCQREGGAWVVTTRWRQTSMDGHLVTVDAATGATRVERYRQVELGGPR